MHFYCCFTSYFFANVFLKYPTSFLYWISTHAVSTVKLIALCFGDYLLIPNGLNDCEWQRMGPSQQDGIFDHGEEPEHLSPQHLSTLFCLPHNKTRASAAKYSQEQHWAAHWRGRSGGRWCTSWSVTLAFLWLYLGWFVCVVIYVE